MHKLLDNYYSMKKNHWHKLSSLFYASGGALFNYQLSMYNTQLEIKKSSIFLTGFFLELAGGFEPSAAADWLLTYFEKH